MSLIVKSLIVKICGLSTPEALDVALDQRRLGDDGRRILPLDADLETATRQPVRRLQRLVTVGDAAEDNRLAPPALLG